MCVTMGGEGRFVESSNNKKKKSANSGDFESLGLNPNVFKVIKRNRYKVPTSIRRKTIPLILSGSDVVAMARTGSCKTTVFLVPMLHRLNQHLPQGSVRALILSPRDLALHTLKFANLFFHIQSMLFFFEKTIDRKLFIVFVFVFMSDLRVSLLVGGDSMESQFEELALCPDIIIATPRRLMNHLSEDDDRSLCSIENFVFDKADCLFGMSFAKQLHQILIQLGESCQTLLFSATLPSAPFKIALDYGAG